MLARLMLILTVVVVISGCAVAVQPDTFALTAPEANLEVSAEVNVPVPIETFVFETDGRLIKESLEREAVSSAGAGLARLNEKTFPETDGRLIKERLELDAMNGK